MTNIIDKMNAYFFVSAHFHFALALILLYFAAYGLAFLLAKGGSTERTLLFRCRRAWAVSLIVHALFVTGLTVKWLLDYGYFASFWSYFPWYLSMLIIDIAFILSALASMGRFSTYHQD